MLLVAALYCREIIGQTILKVSHYSLLALDFHVQTRVSIEAEGHESSALAQNPSPQLEENLSMLALPHVDRLEEVDEGRGFFPAQLLSLQVGGNPLMLSPHLFARRPARTHEVHLQDDPVGLCLVVPYLYRLYARCVLKVSGDRAFVDLEMVHRDDLEDYVYLQAKN